MSQNPYTSQRLSLPMGNLQQPDSTTRTFSPIAFFHDGISTSDMNLRLNVIGSQRRAQAIATAPRRNRYKDEEEEDEIDQKKALCGYMKTAAVPIATPSINQQAQSLPQTQSGISLIPSFRVHPPAREDRDLDYLFSFDSDRKRYSSAPLQ